MTIAIATSIKRDMDNHLFNEFNELNRFVENYSSSDLGWVLGIG
jgi:hypothetical protein